ncbi:MAG: hypothetical protein JOZ81_10435 [Chloroflexi bacterium]|nr:hypothetical protein [Chloroflexota bacterium]
MAFAVLAGVSVLYTTPYGTGSGFDQATYIGAARNLLSGQGLSIPWGVDAGKSLTQFPPLFPVTLAAIGAAGVDPWQGARYVNAFLRIVDVLLAAAIALRIQPGILVAPLVTAFVLCCSVHMVFVFGSAWSEPLFLALALSSLYLLARFLESGSLRLLGACAVVMAAATLTRYVGLALVATGCIILLWRGRGPLAVRAPIAGGFGAIALLPLGLWFVRNAVVAGSIAGARTMGWHSLPTTQLTAGMFTLLDWIVPSAIASRFVTPQGEISAAGAGLVVAAILMGVFLALGHGRLLLVASPLSFVLLIFMVVYTVCVLASMLLFDDLTQLDSRILSPVYVCLAVLLGAYGGRALTDSWRSRRALRPALATVVALFVTAFGIRFGVLVHRLHTEGVMYSNLDWLTSPTMSGLSRLPGDATVFSNAPDAIYLLANRSVLEIPHEADTDSFLDQLQVALHDRAAPVVLVYFDDPNIAYREPVPPAVIANALSVHQLTAYPDGAMYEVSR